MAAKRKMPPVPPNQDMEELQRRWGAQIDPELLDLALTHRSYAYEAGGIPHNERLEFLGDSVLSIVVADRLYRDFPEHAESDLSRMRAATVSQEALAIVANSIGLGDFVKLGKGEANSGGRGKPSILSDTVEALIGATYLTSGLEVARGVVLARTSLLLDQVEERGQTQDWKTTLQEFATAHELPSPVYGVVGSGPDHMRRFLASVSFGDVIDEGAIPAPNETGGAVAVEDVPVGVVLGTATESSKKHAENLAARAAMIYLLGPEADPTL